MSFTYIAADVLELAICTLKLCPFIVMQYTLEIFAAIGAFAEFRFEILTAPIKPLAEYVREYLRDCHVWGLTVIRRTNRSVLLKIARQAYFR